MDSNLTFRGGQIKQMFAEMLDKIPANCVVIPAIIGSILLSLGIHLKEKRHFFKKERMFDLYFLFTLRITVTVEYLLLNYK